MNIANAKRFIVVFCICIVMLNAGCTPVNSLSPIPTVTPTAAPTVTPTVTPAITPTITPTNKMTGGDKVYIPEVPAKLKVPKDYDYFFAETPTDSRSLKNQGLSKSNMDKYMQLSNLAFLALRSDEKFSSNQAAEICIRVKGDKDWYEEIGDLRNLPENEYQEFAQSIASSFVGNTYYDTYETANAKFIVFDCFGTEIRYATILNDKMIYIYVSDKHSRQCEKYIPALLVIVDSFKLAD